MADKFLVDSYMKAEDVEQVTALFFADFFNLNFFSMYLYEDEQTIRHEKAKNVEQLTA